MWTRVEKLTLAGVVVGLVAAIAAVMIIPEVRAFIGLPIATNQSNSSETIRSVQPQPPVASLASHPEPKARNGPASTGQMESSVAERSGGGAIISPKSDKSKGAENRRCQILADMQASGFTVANPEAAGCPGMLFSSGSRVSSKGDKSKDGESHPCQLVAKMRAAGLTVANPEAAGCR
jgi:hypothetical protein